VKKLVAILVAAVVACSATSAVAVAATAAPAAARSTKAHRHHAKRKAHRTRRHATRTKPVQPTRPIATKPLPAPGTGIVGGVAVGGEQPWNSRRAADYQAMGAAHSTWIRSDIGWEWLEPSPGVWDYSVFDPVVNDTKAAGMRYLAILHTVPSWANGGAGDYGLPSNTALMQDYCYHAVKHYLPMGVREYEIGNEVNLPHPGWNPSGTNYTNLYLKPCVTGLRQAASELGLPVTVVFGSMAPTDWSGGENQATFLSEAYGAGAGGWFDAVGWHPYTGGDTPYTSAHMNADPDALHTVMVGHGDGAKKIWATEYGQATGGPNSITESAQATLVTQAFTVWGGKSYAGPMFWYSARDTGTSTTDREQHFGVLRYDGSQKPAYGTLQATLTR
jgi:polysaccharide biosynthesis protein PslG